MSYNDRLQVNNENLEYILDLYNELPEAGEGEPEVTVVPATVNLDFTGNVAAMTVVPNEGEAFSSVSIPKPSDLSSENILENKTIAGIPGSIPNKGAVTATITEKSTSYSIPKGYHNGLGTVGLSNDDQSALIPENIREGVSCLGVTGTLKEGSDITILDGIEVDLDELDLSKEPQTISVPDGYAAKSATILKPADLKPENIVKGAVIAGVRGEYEGSGGGGGEQPTAPKETLLYENANATGFAVDPTFGVPVLQVYPAPFTMSYGKAYRVIWDGTEYLVATQPFAALGAIAVGDLTSFGGAGNGEPFVFGYVPAQNAVVFAGLDANTSHSITVCEITDNQCDCETPIFAVEHMDGFTQAEGVTPAVYQRIVTVGQVFSETETPRFLTVQWDGVPYACPVYSYDGMIFAGNSRFLDSTTPDTGIPFGIVFVGQTEQMTVITTEPGTEHSVAIYSEIVECNGGGSGGGTVEGAATVTFMNGDAVYYTRPEIIGDDCPDPVTQGRVDDPKKESTAQYDYTYSGWSLTDGGAANTTNALKNITEDRTVYAAYTSAVRYYIITYYDSDGTTVLKTESLPYGATAPVSAPTKDGFFIEGFEPAFAPVTGDASYTVQWGTKVSFATGTWTDIARACDSGQAAQNFTVGETRTETINGKTHTLEIIDIDHDYLYDNGVVETRKAGITVWIKTYDEYATQPQAYARPWISGGMHTAVEEPIFDLLAPDLQNAIKTVAKQHQKQLNDTGTSVWGGARIWSLSLTEIGLYSPCTEGTRYAKFSSGKHSDKTTTYDDIKTGNWYWLRSLHPSYGKPVYVSNTGYVYYEGNTSERNKVSPCFCI